MQIEEPFVCISNHPGRIFQSSWSRIDCSLCFIHFFALYFLCCRWDSIICFNLEFLRTEIAMPLFYEYVQKCISAIKHNKTNIESESSLANCVHTIIWPIEFLSIVVSGYYSRFFTFPLTWIGNCWFKTDFDQKHKIRTFQKYQSRLAIIHFRLFLFLFPLSPRQPSNIKKLWKSHILSFWSSWLKVHIPSSI